MDRLALIGVSHRRGGAAALESWQSRFHADALSTLGDQGVGEWVPIITCNRWDLVVALPNGRSVSDLRTQLTPPGETCAPYAYVGDGALEQLCRIAASLDSLNPGEDQIMAQVREAFADAQTRGTTGKATQFAFHTALRVAKRVRREIDLAPMHTSLFSLAKPELQRHLPPAGRIAILGAGEMGTLAAKSLLDTGAEVTVVNRSYDRAHQLARHLGIESLSLEAFLAAPPDLDALVCALSARDLVGRELLSKLPDLKIIVDLGIPRNVVAGAANENVVILNVDTLQSAGQERREALTLKLAEAEHMVQSELEQALSEWTERQLGPAIKRLRDWYLETIGDSLPPEDAAKLAHKFAHVPTKGLRALAREYGLDAAKVFLAETGLE